MEEPFKIENLSSYTSNGYEFKVDGDKTVIVRDGRFVGIVNNSSSLSEVQTVLENSSNMTPNFLYGETNHNILTNFVTNIESTTGKKVESIVFNEGGSYEVVVDGKKVTIPYTESGSINLDTATEAIGKRPTASLTGTDIVTEDNIYDVTEYLKNNISGHDIKYEIKDGKVYLHFDDKTYEINDNVKVSDVVSTISENVQAETPSSTPMAMQDPSAYYSKNHKHRDEYQAYRIDISEDAYNRIISKLEIVDEAIATAASQYDASDLTGKLQNYYASLGVDKKAEFTKMLEQSEDLQVKINYSLMLYQQTDENMQYFFNEMVTQVFAYDTSVPVNGNGFTGLTFAERESNLKTYVNNLQSTYDTLYAQYKKLFGEGVPVDREKVNQMMKLFNALGIFSNGFVMEGYSDDNLFTYKDCEGHELKNPGPRTSGDYQYLDANYWNAFITACEEKNLMPTLKKYIEDGQSWEESGMDALFGENLKAMWQFWDDPSNPNYDIDAETIFLYRYFADPQYGSFYDTSDTGISLPEGSPASYIKQMKDLNFYSYLNKRSWIDWWIQTYEDGATDGYSTNWAEEDYLFVGGEGSIFPEGMDYHSEEARQYVLNYLRTTPVNELVIYDDHRFDKTHRVGWTHHDGWSDYEEHDYYEDINAPQWHIGNNANLDLWYLNEEGYWYGRDYAFVRFTPDTPQGGIIDQPISVDDYELEYIKQRNGQRGPVMGIQAYRPGFGDMFYDGEDYADHELNMFNYSFYGIKNKELCANYLKDYIKGQDIFSTYDTIKSKTKECIDMQNDLASLGNQVYNIKQYQKLMPYEEVRKDPEYLMYLGKDYGTQTGDMAFLDQTELAIYHYLKDHPQAGGCSGYMSALEDTLNQRKGFYYAAKYVEELNSGHKTADELREIWGPLGDVADVFAAADGMMISGTEGLASGVFSFGKGFYNLFAADGVRDASDYAMLYKSVLMSSQNELNENMPDWARDMYRMNNQVMNAVGGMAIPVALSMVPYAGPYLSKTALFLSSMGNNTENAMQNGYSAGQAYLFGATMATANLISEWAFGSIPGLGSNAPNLAIMHGMDYVKALGISMLQEGATEALQTYMEAGIRYYMLGEPFDISAVTEEAFQSFIIGALTAGAMNNGMAMVVKLKSGTQVVIDPAAIEEFASNYGDSAKIIGIDDDGNVIIQTAKGATFVTSQEDLNSPEFMRNLDRVIENPNGKFNIDLTKPESISLELQRGRSVEVLDGEARIIGVNEDGSYQIETKYGERLDRSLSQMNSQNFDAEIYQMNAQHEYELAYDYALDVLNENPEFVSLANEWLDVPKGTKLTGRDSIAIDRFATVLAHFDQKTIDSTVGLLTDPNLLSFYEKARADTSLTDLSAYRTHGVGHIMDVLSSTMDAYYTSQVATGGQVDSSYVDTLIVTALIHDTGMMTDLKSTPVSENGKMTFKISEVKGDKGGTTRSNHSFNSGVNAIILADTIAQHFPGVDPVEAALVAFAHSKSNSGVEDLGSQINWSQCIQNLQAGIDKHNSIEGNTKILIDGVEGRTVLEHFQDKGLISREVSTGTGSAKKGRIQGEIESYTFLDGFDTRLGNEGFIIRVGDANTNNKALNYNQNGKSMRINSDEVITTHYDLERTYYLDENGNPVPMVTRDAKGNLAIAWDNGVQHTGDILARNENGELIDFKTGKPKTIKRTVMRNAEGDLIIVWDADAKYAGQKVVYIDDPSSPGDKMLVLEGTKEPLADTLDKTRTVFQDESGYRHPIFDVDYDGNITVDTDKIICDEIKGSVFYLGGEATDKGAKYVLGENNQDYYTRVYRDKSGTTYFDEVVEVTNPEQIPITTISAALERKGEIDTGHEKIMPNKRFIIQLPADVSPETLYYYKMLKASKKGQGDASKGIPNIIIMVGDKQLY